MADNQTHGNADAIRDTTRQYDRRRHRDHILLARGDQARAPIDPNARAVPLDNFASSTQASGAPSHLRHPVAHARHDAMCGWSGRNEGLRCPRQLRWPGFGSVALQERRLWSARLLERRRAVGRLVANAHLVSGVRLPHCIALPSLVPTYVASAISVCRRRRCIYVVPIALGCFGQ